MVRPSSCGPGRPGGRYHCRAGGVSPRFSPPNSTGASKGKPGLRLPAARPAGPDPGLSPALPPFTSTTPRAQGERARIPSAAAYKGLGRTTPRRGRVVPLLHRRGCAEASISCRVSREGARAAEPRGSLKARPQSPAPKARPETPALGTTSRQGQAAARGRDPRVAPGRAQPQGAPALPWVLRFPGKLERSE